MSRFPALLIAAALLGVPASVSAQTAPATVAEVPSEDTVALRLEAAGTTLMAALENLRPEADTIRADAALTEAVRRERLLDLMKRTDPERAALDVAMNEWTRQEARRQGMTPDQESLGREILRQHIEAGIVEGFVTGENPNSARRDAPD